MLKDDTERLTEVFKLVSSQASDLTKSKQIGQIAVPSPCEAQIDALYPEVHRCAVQVSPDILPSLHVVVRSAAPIQNGSATMSPGIMPTRRQEQRPPVNANGGSAQANGPAATRSTGSPPTQNSGAQAPAAPLSPMPPLIPITGLRRVPSGDGQPQSQMLPARNSSLGSPHAGSQGSLSAAQGSSSAVPMPAAQLPLPRPQSRTQHGPVNAGPTLNPPSGSRVLCLPQLGSVQYLLLQVLSGQPCNGHHIVSAGSWVCAAMVSCSVH